MKPPFRIYTLLKPLSWIWATVTFVRNLFFDIGIFRSERFPLPVISVGNITVGGTGKSPHTAYIASILSTACKVSVLSRGYGRKTKGFRMVTSSDTYLTAGDEPLMLFKQLKNVCIAVDENRAHGINILIDKVNPKVVVLDDAFQHRRITPSLNILLIDYNRNILQDCLLPAGKLRENPLNRKRADIIIVSKCPSDLDNAEMRKTASELITDSNQRIFFTTMEYGDIYGLDENIEYTPDTSTPILAVTGIASPDMMKEYLSSLSDNVFTMSFPDHHGFTRKDIRKICASIDELGPQAIVVTTEKDAVRFRDSDLPHELRKRIFILPIAVRFLTDGKLFDRIITEHVESFKINSHDNI